MTCHDFEARLHPYVDGELPVTELVDADAHAGECARCATLVRRERAFRQLLRRQPREAAPSELRARIVTAIRRDRGPVRLRVALPVLAAAAVLVVSIWFGLPSRPAPLVAELVDTHIAFAQVEGPAELASQDPKEIIEWFRRRAELRVTVPDYSPAGIRLVGARLAEAQERKAAYLLYEKGHVLLSVFMLSLPAGQSQLGGSGMAFRGHEYVTQERKGYRTVAWTDRQTAFALVSMLDYADLLECADRLRAERARETRL
jgi:mycothiol system anti-sigma-R factor